MPKESLLASPGEEIEEGMSIKDALREAGLSGIAKAPPEGSEAHRRLIAAAVGYMKQVKTLERQPAASLKVISRGYNESDSYYNMQALPKKAENSSSSDTIRRNFHNILARMLLGKERTGLPKQEADQLSNFAAYVTGDDSYINKW